MKMTMIVPWTSGVAGITALESQTQDCGAAPTNTEETATTSGMMFLAARTVATQDLYTCHRKGATKPT